MKVTKKKPALVITGFLGAGKTTLLNQVMESNPDLRLALIINEFGDIGLDAALLKTPGEFVEMTNGCLCCALNEDLVNTLENLKNRDDYDAIIIETSGIADPLTIAWTFLRPQFEDKFSLHGIVTVVDPQLLSKKEEHPLLIEQIRAGNLLYVSKTNELTKPQIKVVSQELENINTAAPLYYSPNTSWIRPLLLDDQEIFFDNPQKTDHANYISESEDLSSRKTTLEEMEDYFESLPVNIIRAKAIFFDHLKNKYFALHRVCGRITFEPLNLKPTVLALVKIKIET